MTLQRKKELAEENERVNRIREQLQREKPKVKKAVSMEIMEKRKVRRLLRRSMNRRAKSHGLELVQDVLREVVEELGED